MQRPDPPDKSLSIFSTKGGVPINPFAGKKILVTGGSGSIGGEIVKQLLHLDAAVIRIFSRDETRQVEMAKSLDAGLRVRFLIGDVRDRNRLARAMESVDIVFHAAALKHVPVCEYNPFEAVQTNVVGTQNILTAAREAGVKQVVLISTDKAVSPANTMGATKLLAERLIAAAHSSMSGMVICGVRFGNVLGSRGSLLPLLRRQIRTDKAIKLTDRGMTRFFMTTAQAVELVLKASELAGGGDLFVLPMPKLRVADLIEAVVHRECGQLGWDPKDISIEETGRRPGEKCHEKLLTGAECERAFFKEGFVVIPALEEARNGRQQQEGLSPADFDSETGPFLDRPAIQALLDACFCEQPVPASP